MSAAPDKAPDSEIGADEDSRAVVRAARSNEVFLGVVGPVGAGSSRVIESLRRAAEAAGYAAEVVKASDRIRAWATAKERPLPTPGQKTLEGVGVLQDLGDEMRRTDPASVAKAVLQEVAASGSSNEDDFCGR